MRQSAWVRGYRRIGGGDQADISNLIQNSQNTSVHLKVDETCLKSMARNQKAYQVIQK